MTKDEEVDQLKLSVKGQKEQVKSIRKDMPMKSSDPCKKSIRSCLLIMAG